MRPLHRRPQIRSGNFYNMLLTFGNNSLRNMTAKLIKTKTFGRNSISAYLLLTLYLPIRLSV